VLLLIYTSERVISANAICESSVAIDQSSGRSCFLKRGIIAGQFPEEFVRRTLVQSFDAQRRLSGLVVNKARAIATEGGRTTIEYPFLDPATWHPLSVQDFQEDPLACLTAICFALDYLHLMGLVHLDLKVGNILVNRRHGEIRVRLVDLDFLRPSGTACEGKIFGTVSHIAPEVLRNEHVYPETDSYSLGVLLGALMSSVRSDQDKPDFHPLVEKMELFANALQNEDRLSRPRYLIETMHSMAILDTIEYEKVARRLLQLLFISKYKKVGRSSVDADAFVKFLHQNVRILGLHSELISLCAERAKSSQSKVLAVFKRILGESQISTAGEFWILTPSDSLMQWVYKLLDRRHEEISHALSANSNDCQEDVAIATKYMHQLRDAGELEQSLLLGMEIFEVLQNVTDLEGEGRRCDIARDLGSVAYRLNRLEQADRYFAHATHAVSNANNKQGDYFYTWAVVNFALGESNCALNVIGRGLDFARSVNDSHLRLQLSRLSIWDVTSRGEFDVARQALREIRDEAKLLEYSDVVNLATYFLSIIEWRQGRNFEAKDLLIEAASLSDESNPDESLIPVASMLALVLSEIGEFESATKQADKAARLCETLRYVVQLPSICLTAVYSCTRLACYDKSAEWCQRYLTDGRHRHSTHYLLGYYQASAFACFNQGRIAEAIDICSKAINLPTESSDAKLLGKVYQILSEASLFAGDTSACARYSDVARRHFLQCHDTTSEKEVLLIAALGTIIYKENSDLSAACNLVRELEVRGSHFCAMSGAFAIFLRGKQNQTTDFGVLLAKISDKISSPKVPLFSVVRQLVQLPNWPQTDPLTLLPVLKTAYSQFLDTGQLLHAMLTALRTAELYGELGQRKHQSKFLEQAELVANRLGNQAEVERIRKRLSELRHVMLDPERGTETLVNISRVLSQERDFQKAAGQLLRFAIEETGAERGVLLLRHTNDTRLTAVASINCDNASVKDVIDFSTTVPQSALSKPEPTIIEDALSDTRTNSMKSIVLHNVRSIIATPLFYDKELLGVLYLDHHSIPALFSQDDIEYVSAIANFVAVSLVNARDYRDISRSHNELAEYLTRTGVSGSFITQDPIMQRLLEMIPTIARSDTPVLLVGESGTGKEILCQMIHDHSKRKKRPLVKMNCAAIAGSMVESELFGVARGAATGVAQREGKFAAADGGTLYMDEIGDMPLDLQAKVLRVLEYQEFEKVGSNRSESVDVRFVYGTNKDLPAAVKEGKFRNDLLFRINTITIIIPSLRDRRSDVPLLLEHFGRVFSVGKQSIKFTPEAIAILTAYQWPGNVRELRNLVERFCVLYSGREISAKMLPVEVSTSIDMSAFGPTQVKTQEKEIIRTALVQSGWNRSKAATALGIPLTTLRRKITILGIRPPF
jgi:transcriptional regulator with GAF, ATPase, and Fis domain